MVLRYFALAAALLLSLLVNFTNAFAQDRYGGIIVVDGAECFVEDIPDNPGTLKVFDALPINTLVNVFLAEPKFEGYTLIGVGAYNDSCMIDPASVERVDYDLPVGGVDETPPAVVEEPVIVPEEQEPIEEDCTESCDGEPDEVFLGDISVNADGTACQVWPSRESETFTWLSSGMTVSQIADGKEGDGWQKVRIYTFDEPAYCYVAVEYLGVPQESSESEAMPLQAPADPPADSSGTTPSTPPQVTALPSTGSGSARGMLAEMLGEAAIYVFAAAVCFIAACWAGYREYKDEADAVACRIWELTASFIWRPTTKALAWMFEAAWLYPFAFGLLGADAIRAVRAGLKSHRTACRRRHTRYAPSYAQ